jgi:hypothetical protein
MTLAEIFESVGESGRKGQVGFLVNLANELTIAARSTYQVGSDQLENPEQLRTYNELQHRILACLRQMINDDAAQIWI